MFETEDGTVVGGILCNSSFEFECSQSIVGESVRPTQLLGRKIEQVKCLKPKLDGDRESTSTGTEELARVVGHTCVSEIIDILVVPVISTISVDPDEYFFFFLMCVVVCY